LSQSDDTSATYDVDAARIAGLYESMSSTIVHAQLAEFIPAGPGLALDVGAGSGRDAAWLASLGYDVVAAEPAAGMRREGRSRHPGPAIRWIDDRLPDLFHVHRLGLSFEVILASAVWMHVPPAVRARAFRKLATLLKPGGIILITLRHGPVEQGRVMWPTSAGEIDVLARSHGLAVLRSILAADRRQRPGVSWTQLCLQLPDNGTGALPLRRGIILNDDKSSTYELALLRAILRVADGTPSLAAECADIEAVDLPLGLAALNLGSDVLAVGWCAHPSIPRKRGSRGAWVCEGRVPGARSIRHCRAGASLRRPVYGRTRVGNRKSIDRRRSDDRAHAGPLHAVPQFKSADL
jgi:SAM-dependent methyltransferase